MKINRLLETTILLLNRGTVTAKELSERFEVSTRTIYRDLDILSSAGVPVYSSRGAGGGISLLEPYALNKALISEQDSKRILAALQTLKAARYPEVDGILEKLGALFHGTSPDWLEIDFTPWSCDPNEHGRFETVRWAILECRVAEFDYRSAQNTKTRRRVEPLKLIFRGQTWYLWAWDRMREDYRTFRVTRMRRVALTGETFERNHPRTRKPETASGSAKPLVALNLRFTPDVLYRLYDDFDESLLRQNPDGSISVEVSFPEDEWVYGYLLSFGPSVEIISPEHIRRIVKEKAEKILEIYR